MSHSTIHIFKNYFVTVLSIFSFSNNKLNPNGPIVLHSHRFFFFFLVFYGSDFKLNFTLFETLDFIYHFLKFQI